MAAETHSLSLSTSGGDQTITFDDSSFNPKCCIAVSTSQTSANSTGDGSTVRIGLWAEGDQQAVYAGAKVQGGGRQGVERLDTDAIFIHLNGTPIIKQEARIKSVTSGSAVIENIVTHTNANKVFFHFFDAEECCVFAATAQTSAATKAYTHANLDFNPDVIIAVADGYTSINAHRKNDWSASFGAATSNSVAAENVSIGVGHNEGGDDSADVQGNGDCIYLVEDDATVTKQAHWSASGANEFTLDYDVANASAYYNIFMCIKIGSAFAGVFDTGTSTTSDVEVDDPTFQPDNVIFLTNNHSALDAVQDTAHFNIGFAAPQPDSPSNHKPDVSMVTSGDGGANYNRRFDNNSSVLTLNDAGTSTENDGVVSTYDSLGFHVDLDTNSGTKKVSYLALSSAAVTANPKGPLGQVVLAGPLGGPI